MNAALFQLIGQGIATTAGLVHKGRQAGGVGFGLVAETGQAAGQDGIQRCGGVGEAYGERLDVTDQGAVDAAVDGMVARWGRIDIGFNNAGISIAQMGGEWGQLDTCEQEWAVNQRGVLYCMRAELRHMVAQGSGSIVNTASIAGMSGIAGAGYSGSKHAVIGLTRSAALAPA